MDGELIDLLSTSEPVSVVEIRSGDEVVAYLRFQGTDYPWIEYSFEAQPAWFSLGTEVESFYASVRTGYKGIDAIAKAIVDLDLWLFLDREEPVLIGDFILLVRGEVARVRSYPRGERASATRARFGA